MRLVLYKPKNIPQGRPLPPEILAQSDPPSPDSSASTVRASEKRSLRPMAFRRAINQGSTPPLTSAKMGIKYLNLSSFIQVSTIKDEKSAAKFHYITKRPASADRTARRQFQATGQPVSRTQASDAMPSRLPRYEAKCVQRRCLQCGSVPLRSDIKGTQLPPANILIPLERQLIALQLCS